jgi:23S rRNA pseudouridine2605 synthase
MDGNTDQYKSGERVAKVIARAGLASRREAEDWIAAGRVAVNGAVIRSAALNVTEGDRVSVDGAPLPERERTRLFLYHKPRGLITTHADPQGRPTIFQKLPKNLPRLISVGRLDYNTEGLLLLTNDGALARVLELPATGWLRRYRVRAHGSIMQDKLNALRAGVTISGIHYGAIDAAIERMQGSNLWLTFAIREGKNREVRTVLSHLGLEVTRLIRVSFGPFQLAELEEGAVEEVRTRVLREQLGERLVASAGADFSAPVTIRADPDVERQAPPRRGDRPRDALRSKKTAERPADARPKPKRRSKGAEHAWRAHDDEQPVKKLHRQFRGVRGDNSGAKPGTKPGGTMRVASLTDRKGRRVPVERYGEPPVREAPKDFPKRGRFTERGGERGSERGGERPAGRTGKFSSKFSGKPPGKRSGQHSGKPSGRRRAADRASGARPRHPKSR